MLSISDLQLGDAATQKQLGESDQLTYVAAVGCDPDIPSCVVQPRMHCTVCHLAFET